MSYPNPDYEEGLYRAFHGRPTSRGHVGCYLSHVRAMKMFLETTEEYALIGEDDIVLGDSFDAVLQAAIGFGGQWDILRLTGLGGGQPLVLSRLSPAHELCISLGRIKGTGAYLLNRKAAEILSRELLPMRLPIDHAMDREWFFGLMAAYVYPFPASQIESGFRSSIQIGKSHKLPKWRRYALTYPYQIVNELARFLFRGTNFLFGKMQILQR